MVVESVPPIEVRFFSSVTSTNEIARKIVSRNGGDGTMVVADHQTMGRGRQGRRWFSPPCLGLWATLILCPHLEGKELFTLGLAAAVAICKAVEAIFSIRPVIQWPNDLYLEDRKFGGILVEVLSDCGGVDYALLGMGINLSQKKEDFPPELQNVAISLGEVLGVDVDRRSFLESLNILLRSELQLLYDQGFAGIKEDYCERSNLLQNWVTVRLEDGNIEGRVIGFGSNGELMVSIDGSPVRKLTHGEVHKVWR